MPRKVLVSTWRDPGKVAMDGALACEGTLPDQLVAGLTAAEEDPNLFLVGRGALPNENGVHELDAAIMEGRDLSAGAVCGVTDICPVIQVARLVKERTSHVMLSGAGAREFALKNGFQPRDLHTDESRKRYAEWLASPESSTANYTHSPTEESHHGDTVTLLGFDEGRLWAASSTSGLQWKMPGRVGDSPIIGAGIYADDEAGAAGATGWGEMLWRASASSRIVELMRQGHGPQEACDEVVRFMTRRLPGASEMMCAVLAISNEGEVGASTTVGEFPAWIWMDGKLELRHFNPPA